MNRERIKLLNIGWHSYVLGCLLSYFVFLFIGFDNIYRIIFLSMGIGSAIGIEIMILFFYDEVFGK